jgi:ubiquitin C-terminal hydrolase
MDNDMQNICYKLNKKFDEKMNKYNDVLTKYNNARKQINLEPIKPKWQTGGGHINFLNVLNDKMYEHKIYKWQKKYNSLITDTNQLENKFLQNHVDFNEEIKNFNNYHDILHIKPSVREEPVREPIREELITWPSIKIKPFKSAPIKKPLDGSPIEKPNTGEQIDIPIEEKPIEEKPIEEKPIEEKPIEEEPIEEKPIEEKPIEEKPIEEKSFKEEPVKDSTGVRQKTINFNGVNIIFDDLYVTYATTKNSTDYKIVENVVIVDPANDTNLQKIINKKSTSALYASGSIYELYNITTKVEYTEGKDNNNEVVIGGYNYEKHNAVGLHHKKGWIIHSVGPNNSDITDIKKFKEALITTYINIFKTFCNIQTKDNVLTLRLTLVGLGSYAHSKLKDSKEKMKFVIGELIPNVLKKIDGKCLNVLQKSTIQFALGDDFVKLPEAPTNDSPVKEPSKKTLRQPPGIVNLQNTCFYNSLAQLFYRMTELTTFITNKTIMNQYKDKNKIDFVPQDIKPFEEGTKTKLFIELLKQMSNPEEQNLEGEHNKKYLSSEFMRKIITGCGIDWKKQEDISEFLVQVLKGFVLNNTSNELNNLNIKSQKLYNGAVLLKEYPHDDPRNFILTKEIGYCCTTNKNDTNFNKDDYDKCKDKYIFCGGAFNNTINLYIPEGITHINDLIKCYTGDVTFEDVKKYSLYTSNNNLIFNKKQLFYGNYVIFSLNRYNLDGTKIFQNISLVDDDNETIKLNNDTYELVGIVVHIGSISEGGHYVAFIKYDTWYLYDDTNVTKYDKYTDIINYFSKYNNNVPYIALYRKYGEFKVIDIPINKTLDEYLVDTSISKILQNKQKIGNNSEMLSITTEDNIDIDKIMKMKDSDITILINDGKKEYKVGDAQIGGGVKRIVYVKKGGFGTKDVFFIELYFGKYTLYKEVNKDNVKDWLNFGKTQQKTHQSSILQPEISKDILNNIFNFLNTQYNSTRVKLIELLDKTDTHTPELILNFLKNDQQTEKDNFLKLIKSYFGNYDQLSSWFDIQQHNMIIDAESFINSPHNYENLFTWLNLQNSLRKRSLRALYNSSQPSKQNTKQLEVGRKGTHWGESQTNSPINKKDIGSEQPSSNNKNIKQTIFDADWGSGENDDKIFVPSHKTKPVNSDQQPVKSDQHPVKSDQQPTQNNTQEKIYPIKQFKDIDDFNLYIKAKFPDDQLKELNNIIKYFKKHPKINLSNMLQKNKIGTSPNIMLIVSLIYNYLLLNHLADNDTTETYKIFYDNLDAKNQNIINTFKNSNHKQIPVKLKELKTTQQTHITEENLYNYINTFWENIYKDELDVSGKLVTSHKINFPFTEWLRDLQRYEYNSLRDYLEGYEDIYKTQSKWLKNEQNIMEKGLENFIEKNYDIQSLPIWLKDIHNFRRQRLSEQFKNNQLPQPIKNNQILQSKQNNNKLPVKTQNSNFNLAAAEFVPGNTISQTKGHNVKTNSPQPINHDDFLNVTQLYGKNHDTHFGNYQPVQPIQQKIPKSIEELKIQSQQLVKNISSPENIQTTIKNIRTNLDLLEKEKYDEDAYEKLEKEIKSVALRAIPLLKTHPEKSKIIGELSSLTNIIETKKNEHSHEMLDNIIKQNKTTKQLRGQSKITQIPIQESTNTKSKNDFDTQIKIYKDNLIKLSNGEYSQHNYEKIGKEIEKFFNNPNLKINISNNHITNTITELNNLYNTTITDHFNREVDKGKQLIKKELDKQLSEFDKKLTILEKKYDEKEYNNLDEEIKELYLYDSKLWQNGPYGGIVSIMFEKLLDRMDKLKDNKNTKQQTSS